MAFHSGDLGSAVTFAEEAEREAVASDDFVFHARALFAAAGIRRWLGEPDSALVLVERGLSWARRAEDPCLEAEGALVRLAVLYSMGTASVSELDALEDREPRCGSSAIRAEATLTRARFAARAGHVENAMKFLDQAENMFVSASLQAELGQERLFLEAYLLGQQGRHTEAVERLESVLSTDRGMNARPALVDDLLLMARLYRDAGDMPAARDAANRALAVIAAMTPPDLTKKRRKAVEDWLEELGPEE